ncbi:MAG TPA: HAD-IA family hydrolase [Gemmatimonadaceae bacterium]|nr:HAD-IA family hydrolase [Gemmatimonadaceae bacterium]
MPSRKPLAILFDLDGTLADSLELILGAFRHTFFTHLGAVPSDTAWIAGMGTPLITQLRSLVADEALIEPMTATYRSWQNEHHDELLREFEGVRETLSLLHDRGHHMALVTSKATDAAKRALHVMGIGALLDHVVGFDSTTTHKPDAEPVLHALALLHREATEAIFVGDSPHDIAAGTAAGVFTVAALWGPFSRQTLEAARPSRLIADIRDLPPLIQALTAAALAPSHT